MLTNTCYSFVDDKNAGHIVTVHAYDAAQQTMVVLKGSSDVSNAANELDGAHAMSWAKDIWADMLG